MFAEISICFYVGASYIKSNLRYLDLQYLGTSIYRTGKLTEITLKYAEITKYFKPNTS